MWGLQFKLASPGNSKICMHAYLWEYGIIHNSSTPNFKSKLPFFRLNFSSFTFCSNLAIYRLENILPHFFLISSVFVCSFYSLYYNTQILAFKSRQQNHFFRIRRQRKKERRPRRPISDFPPKFSTFNHEIGHLRRPMSNFQIHRTCHFKV